MSTFHGLEVAKRGLFTQQSALYTTGHNIANANTPGYTRQRVNFEQTAPFPPASRNRPEIPGQVGSGVQAGSIERVREEFLDIQFRGEHNKAGYWETKANSMQKMEEIMNEPSENGLSKTMDRFWQSLQDLATNPEDAGARSVVQQRGIAVAKTFNYLSDSLKSIQKDLQNEMDVTTKEVNSLLVQIDALNKQISDVEPHGLLPNDLYDERDRLIDQLSGLIHVEVSYESSDGQASKMAMGKANITLINGSDRYSLVKADPQTGESSVKPLTVNYTEVNGAEVFGSVTVGDSGNISSFSSQGKLLALKEAFGYTTESGIVNGTYPEMLSNLDRMATAFARDFNEVHRSGASLNDIKTGDFIGGTDFFKLPAGIPEGEVVNGYAETIDLTDAIKKDPGNIAAAEIINGEAHAGNGENALNLADVKDAPLDLLGENSSVKSFYEAVIGGMAVQAQESNRMADNSVTLEQAVNQRRQSVSAVSLDEEMTNMIKFQHAYNAAARSMTAVDEMLDRIINQMGLVGR
ncbi:flagellar hook-associated protein FlgK [Thalassobacillus pellis]|uniref:flagellar hook-associated protein FlgK n=1 Tax=Thalassobacillus pellis TaxID=748008 RepID=UPI00195FF0E2|nr:flagellar hook-associated protein FlgK [Thalassobacillus pellis]MBM7551434.1 flagellar hook-associated protein 1 FlgK [Thalassobacillus pellis]